jgi:hypothetical protein
MSSSTHCEAVGVSGALISSARDDVVLRHHAARPLARGLARSPELARSSAARCLERGDLISAGSRSR